MTEIEKLQTAKMYLDKLANGINPFDGTDIPEGEIIHNVRLSRCFFFLSNTVEQIVENGGICTEHYAKKASFCITAELLAKFRFSSDGIPISKIAERVNALIDTEKMCQLSYKKFVDWLIKIGMLEQQTLTDGKTVKYPTEQGRQLGIYTEERVGTHGRYAVVLYNSDAQHFLIDNIDTVING